MKFFGRVLPTDQLVMLQIAYQSTSFFSFSLPCIESPRFLKRVDLIVNNSKKFVK